MNKETIQSGIYGLTIGDALGVPVEFKTRQELRKNPVTTMIGYGTWNQPKGTWSDDTSMTLATLSHITKENGKINYENLMKEFVKWAVNGEYTQNIGVEPFDYGGTTIQAIINYLHDGNIKTCGLKHEHNNGNGSLMRILPLAFIDCDYKTIENVSALTHAHDRSKIACSLYVTIAKEIIKGGEETFCDYVSNASDKIQKHYRNNQELHHFQRIFDSNYDNGISSGTYVVDSLETAIYSIKYGEDYQSSVLGAINLGGDTDTNGAICGGLAGLYYGFQDIPSDWIDTIYGRELIDNIITDFMKNVGDIE